MVLTLECRANCRIILYAVDVNVNVNTRDPTGCSTSTCTQRMTPTYSIGDLAREFDLTTRAIRFYEDLGLLQPERSGPGGRSRVYSVRDRTRLKLTLRAKRLGLSLTEAKDIIDTYDGPRDTGAQLKKFLDVLAVHRKQIEEQMADLQANLDEIKEHQREARAMLLKADERADVSPVPKSTAKPKAAKSANKVSSHAA